VVILFEIWKSAPFTFLFVTARLQNVPAELEDAAAIDGANARQRLTHIVLPQLRTVVMVLLLLRFIWSFQNFNDIYLLTQGAGGTEVMAVKVFKELTERADVGSAAAYGLCMTVILLVFGAGWALVNRRKEAMRAACARRTGSKRCVQRSSSSLWSWRSGRLRMESSCRCAPSLPC